MRSSRIWIRWIEAYYHAFDQVCVVGSETSFMKLNAMVSNSPVGIYVLTKHNAISARQKMNLSPMQVHSLINQCSSCFESVNTSISYIPIYGFLPEATPVFWYGALFSKIPIARAYTMVLQTLKKRVSIQPEQIQEVMGRQFA